MTMRSQSLETYLSHGPNPLSPKRSAVRLFKLRYIVYFLFNILFLHALKPVYYVN